MDNPRAATPFLPLTVSAAGRIAEGHATRRPASSLYRAAVAAEETAGDAWLSMLGGAHTQGRALVSPALGALCVAVAGVAGVPWWFSAGTCYRRRAEDARLAIEDAAREGDGAEFAEAFSSFDQCIATVLTSAPGEQDPGDRQD